MARNFEIIAAFPDAGRAERAAQALERRGLPKRHLHLVRGTETSPARRASMRSEMAEEVNRSVAGPGVGVFAPDQATGAAAGTFVGAIAGIVVGLAVGALWAFGFQSVLSEAGRLAIAALCFLFAGAVIGFVVGGSMKPRIEGSERPGRMLDERTLAGTDDTLLEVEVSSESEAHMVEEVLEHAGAERVDAVDRDGTPLPPQRDHPRPADPPEYWQGNGRSSG